MLEFKRCRKYRGVQLYGEWLATIKIDGVRAMITRDGCFSRRGKPLYNLDHLATDYPQDVEVFCGTWEETITKVRSQSYQLVEPYHVYPLDPIDDRLHLKSLVDPSPDEVASLLAEVNALGYEGLVLRQDDLWLKVKSLHTFDVEVLGLIPGQGKHEDRLGALVTSMGRVGTGFSDEERERYYVDEMIGKIIEVKCMEVTPDGKFRHPRFIRVREDLS